MKIDRFMNKLSGLPALIVISTTPSNLLPFSTT